MKTFNDLNQPIYICHCCTRTWLDNMTYQMHLEAMIRALRNDLKKDLGVI